MKIVKYNQAGEKIGEISLSADVFNVPMKPEVLHQVVVAMEANQRTVLAHTKGRAEVRGGGKKPWRQKGTGRARHGSRRSPIWIGGGVTFGPTKDRNFSKKINKKVKRIALLMVLSDRAKKGLKVVDKFDLPEIKTKEMRNILQNLKVEKSTLVVLDILKKEIVKSLNNLPKVEAVRANSVNPLLILKYKNLLVTEAAVKKMQESFGKEK